MTSCFWPEPTLEISHDSQSVSQSCYLTTLSTFCLSHRHTARGPIAPLWSTFSLIDFLTLNVDLVNGLIEIERSKTALILLGNVENNVESGTQLQLKEVTETHSNHESLDAGSQRLRNSDEFTWCEGWVETIRWFLPSARPAFIWDLIRIIGITCPATRHPSHFSCQTAGH